MFTPLSNFCGSEREIVILKEVASSVRHHGLIPDPFGLILVPSARIPLEHARVQHQSVDFCNAIVPRGFRSKSDWEISAIRGGEKSRNPNAVFVASAIRANSLAVNARATMESSNCNPRRCNRPQLCDEDFGSRGRIRRCFPRSLGD